MASAPNDAELIDRARRGDRDAYGLLVVRYQEIAFRTAWIITRNSEDAEDVAQEAFVKAWSALDRFRVGAPFRPWLLRIVANEAKNRVVARTRRSTTSFDARIDLPDRRENVVAVVLASEEQRHLVRMIESLDERDRLVIYLKYALELTEPELAAALECPRGTVKSRLHRALQRLRYHYEQECADA